MSSDWIGVAGVSVGGVLGYLSQSITDSRRAKRDRQVESRSEQRSAYAEVLAAYGEATYKFGLVSGARASGSARFAEFTMDALPTLARVNAAVSRVALVAPEDTRDAAQKVLGALYVLADNARGKDVQVDPKPWQEFVRLARRDLDA